MPKNSTETFALTSAYVEMLHDEGIAMFWPGIEPVGKLDCLNLGLLESSVKGPLQTLFGQDAYPTMHEKAACLFHSLIANHCFSNGNKRTAVLAIDQFLYANSFVLALPNEDMKTLAEETAAYRQNRVAPKSMMSILTDIVESSIIPFSALRQAQPKFYRQCINWRRQIRSHPLNAPDAIPEQARVPWL